MAYRWAVTPHPIFSLRANIDLSQRERRAERAALNSKPSARLAQAEPARDDAAQHLRGAALNGEFWSDLHCVGQYGVEDFVIAGVRLDKGCEIPHPLRQLLFPDR